MQQEVPHAIDLKVVNAAKCHLDDVRLGSRRNYEIIFEPALVAVIDHVDARIDLRVAHASKTGNVCVPFSWIWTSEIVTGGRQLFETLDSRIGIGAFQFHPHDAAGRSGPTAT